MAGALVEQWLGVTGLTIADIPVNTAPSNTTTITELFMTHTGESVYGRRVRGVITAPVTGNYSFWIIADDLGEFWFDAGYGLVKICQATFTYEYANDYDANANQHSATVALVAGQEYEFMVLHKQNQPSGDFFKVVWDCDQAGVTYQSTVPCSALDDTTGLSSIPPWINPGFVGESSRRQWPKAADMSAIDLSKAAPRQLYRRYAKAATGLNIPDLRPNHNYIVRVHGMEGYYNAAGSRTFRLRINGIDNMTLIDFFAISGGKFKAALYETTVTSQSNGLLTVEFIPVNGIPKISGLEIRDV
jgi:hypothetical protein